MDGTRGILTYHPRLWLCVSVHVYACVCVTGSERRSPPTGFLFFSPFFYALPISRRAVLASLRQPPSVSLLLANDNKNYHNKQTTGTTLGPSFNSSLPLLSPAKLVRSLQARRLPRVTTGTSVSFDPLVPLQKVVC